MNSPSVTPFVNAHGFGPNANGEVLALVAQPNGNIPIDGIFATFSPQDGDPVNRHRVAWLNPEGTLDTVSDRKRDQLGQLGRQGFNRRPSREYRRIDATRRERQVFSERLFQRNSKDACSYCWRNREDR